MNRRYWTTTEIRTMRALYPNTANPEIGKTLGRTDTAVMLMALKLGLRKSPAFMAGPVVRWQAGNRPWNAGKRGWQAGGKAKLTQFKSGHRGPRQRPVGTERPSRDGIEIKVAEPSVWISKRRYVWEKHFGKIPEGSIVRLKDGNNDNLEPANLLLIDRRDHVRMNWKPRGPAIRRAVAWIAPIAVASAV